MAKSKVTSYDVARKAGVSRTTVSYVLNGVDSGISPETAQRVNEAARELGYVPNAAGKALASKRTKNIGFFCLKEQLTHTHILKILSGLNNITQSHNFKLLLDTYVESPRGGTLLSLSRAKSIDGLILFEIKEQDEELKTLLDENFPVVVMGNCPDHRVCSVDVDVELAARKATKHLIDLGHRRLGFISNAPLIYTTSSSRLTGFREAAAEGGEVREEWILTGNFTAASGYEAGKSLLKGRELPTALFVASDTVAFGVIKALNEGGISVPDELSVIGFDNVPLGPYFIPSLSTIHFDGYESGRVAGEMLIDLIDEKVEPGRRRLLETTLIQRESSRPFSP